MVDEYLSNKSILIVGDGDLAYSTSLATYSKTIPKSITATIFDSYETAVEKYGERFRTNFDTLKKPEKQQLVCPVDVICEVDATQLHINEKLKSPFDCIVFNFPHTGGKTNIRKCRTLIKNVMISVKDCLEDDGFLFISLTSIQSGLNIENGLQIDIIEDMTEYQKKDSWQPIEVAASVGFLVKEVIKFDPALIPGYKPTGYREGQRSFHIRDSQTIVFEPAQLLTPFNMHHLNICSFEKLSVLRTAYIHDIAFYCSTEFDQLFYVEEVIKFSRGIVKSVTLLPQFSFMDQDPPSRCYRIIWQSRNMAMNKTSCRDIQLKLRHHVQKIIGAVDEKFVLR